MWAISIARKSPVKYDEVVKYIWKCNCDYCNWKDNIEIIKDKNAKLHFLDIIKNEIESIEWKDTKERIDSYLERLDDAIDNYSKIISFKRKDYWFLITYNKVFTKLKDKYYV
mgnify:FL=1